MLTITADTVGRHDFLYTPCSPETFTLLYDHKGHHPSCLENLVTNLALPNGSGRLVTPELGGAPLRSLLPLTRPYRGLLLAAVAEQPQGGVAA